MVSAEFDPIQFWEYWSVSNVLPITLAVGITERTVCGKLTTTGTCWQHWRENQKYAFEYESDDEPRCIKTVAKFQIKDPVFPVGQGHYEINHL